MTNDFPPSSSPSDEHSEGGPFGRRYFLYGRRGRALGSEKQAHIDTLHLRYGFELTDFPDILEQAQGRPIRLEIGFGSGDHLAYQASLYPDILFLGVEPFLNGYATTLEKFDRAGLENVRVLKGDARLLLDALPDNQLERIYLLYPDPWPKKRHSHRRFIQQDSLNSLYRVLQPKGCLCLASDIPEYVRWSLIHVYQQDLFHWTASSQQDWETPFDDWCSTKYERKALREGRIPYYLQFTK